MHPKYLLVTSILNDPWFISLDYNLEQINALVELALNPNIAAESDSGVYEPQTSGRVAVIPILGVLTKYDGPCGALGLQSYSKMFQQAAADPAIDAIVLKFDSPGGQVSGTETFANEIASCSKPVVGFVDDLACSGAYWLLSKCDHVIANHPTAQIGSIGVMCTYNDYTAANEKAGIKVHNIYAPQSKLKNKLSRQMQGGDFTEVQQELGVIADGFITSVKASRPAVTKEHLTGDVFFAKDVVGTLIDSIGTIDDAIAKAFSLTKSNKSMPTPKPAARLAAATGVDSFETTDGSIFLNAEQVVAIEAHLETVATTSTENNSLSTQLSTATSSIATLTTERDRLQARVTELESAAGSSASVVTPAVDGGAVSKSMSQAAAEAVAKTYL